MAISIAIRFENSINVTTNPSEETFECCISVLQKSSSPIPFNEVTESVSAKSA
jgi:hypothetical protein